MEWLKFQIRIGMKICLCFMCFLLVSGCNKIIDWGQQNFKQAQKHSYDIVEEVQKNLKSTIAYNQLATMAQFDVLCLTDQVRLLYVMYHKRCQGLTLDEENMMIQRVLNENKYFISFYIVGSQPDNFYESNKALFTGEFQKQESLLGDDKATWHVRLKINEKEYFPVTIKVVDLPIEFRHFFGHKYSQFKTAYQVRFNAQDENGHPLLKPRHLNNFSLIFKSAFCQADIVWEKYLYNK